MKPEMKRKMNQVNKMKQHDILIEIAASKKNPFNVEEIYKSPAAFQLKEDITKQTFSKFIYQE